MPKSRRIQRLINEWQSRLRLDDWDVVYAGEPDDEKHNGETAIVLTSRRVVIKIASKPHVEGVAWNVEQIVIHELVHLFLQPIRWMADGFGHHPIEDQAVEAAEEEAVDRISIAIWKMWKVDKK